MDPNAIAELYGAISGYLSPAAQAAIVAVLAALGIQVGRKTKQNRSAKKAQGTPSSSSSEETSPGQSGPGATREMTAAEIRKLKPEYSPANDNRPDPGEVVWTWVPYVENDGRGKDRPVLILARIDDSDVAGCYLSTKDHDGFVPMGTGGWDSQGRESYLNPERVLRVSNSGMRREGSRISKDRFNRAVAAVEAYQKNR